MYVFIKRYIKHKQTHKQTNGLVGWTRSLGMGVKGDNASITQSSWQNYSSFLTLAFTLFLSSTLVSFSHTFQKLFTTEQIHLNLLTENIRWKQLELIEHHSLQPLQPKLSSQLINFKPGQFSCQSIVVHRLVALLPYNAHSNDRKKVQHHQDDQQTDKKLKLACKGCSVSKSFTLLRR